MRTLQFRLSETSISACRVRNPGATEIGPARHQLEARRLVPATTSLRPGSKSTRTSKDAPSDGGLLVRFTSSVTVRLTQWPSEVAPDKNFLPLKSCSCDSSEMYIAVEVFASALGRNQNQLHIEDVSYATSNGLHAGTVRRWPASRRVPRPSAQDSIEPSW